MFALKGFGVEPQFVLQFCVELVENTCQRLMLQRHLAYHIEANSLASFEDLFVHVRRCCNNERFMVVEKRHRVVGMLLFIRDLASDESIPFFLAQLLVVVLGVQLLDLLACFEAVHDRHRQVHDDCTEVHGRSLQYLVELLRIIELVELLHVFLDLPNGLVAVDSRRNLQITSLLHHLLQHHELERVVIDD